MLLLSNLLADNDDGRLAPRQVEFARTIFSAGKDLLALINQVLDLAKVESGRQEIEIGPVPLAELAERARRVFTPLARDKDLAFAVTVAAELPDTLPTDRRRVEQILTNLLGNAIKFTAKGEVGLRIGPASADARFRRSGLEPRDVIAFVVSDTGLGIAPEDHERVFAPFEQVDAAADRRFGGTGLGLGIARELATLLGGELQLRSTLGAGSTFTCFLPRTAPAQPAAATAAAMATVEGAGAQSGRAPSPAASSAKALASGHDGAAPLGPGEPF